MEPCAASPPKLKHAAGADRQADQSVDRASPTSPSTQIKHYDTSVAYSKDAKAHQGNGSNFERHSNGGSSRVAASVQQLSPLELKLAFCSIWAFGMVLSLDRLTSPSYQTVATNSFGNHSLLSLVAVVKSIAAAIAGPPFAQLCEMAGLNSAFLCGIALYSAGCLIMASASKLIAFGIDGAVYELGANGLVVAQCVLIANATSSQNRLFFQLLPQLPFVVLAYPSASIYASVLSRWGWCWGIGMFAALGPIALLPLLIVLVIGDRRASSIDKNAVLAPQAVTSDSSEGAGEPTAPPCKMNHGISLRRLFGLAPSRESIASRRTGCLIQWIWKLLQLADVVGLVLLSCCVAALLVPLTLVAREPGKWGPLHVLLPLCLGATVTLPAFVLWERYGASRPVIPLDLVKQRTWLLPSVVTCLFWIAYMVQGSYLATYLYVVIGTTSRAQQSVSVTYSAADCLFGIVIVSTLVRWTRRLYPFQVLGLITGIVGMSLMAVLRSPSHLVAIALMQAVIGLSGALVVAPLQVTVQVSVDEVRLPSAIAALNIFNALGNGIGSAVAGAIWAGTLRKQLFGQTSTLIEADAESVYSEPLTWIASYAIGTAERSAVIHAYTETQKALMATAAAVSGLALLVGFFLPRPILGADRMAEPQAKVNGTAGLEAAVGGDKEAGAGHGDDSQEEKNALPLTTSGAAHSRF
ncbi:hypothetical protein ACQY0O_003567 [Thecaphora frezii]